MFRSRYFYFLALALLLQSCKTRQPAVTVSPSVINKSQDKEEPAVYRASNPRLNDLVHTSLKVSFDWKKMQMPGKAEITLHPHFYPQNNLILNAHGMQINEVSMVKPAGRTKLDYQYRNDSLLITLDRSYNSAEEYKIYIDYIAKPEELDSVGGSSAITSDKGLFFINADGKDKFKPRQIWTQGETQSNSVWMPTIDAPNQKMTQDIAITVDSAFITLSNGLLVKSVLNPDATRTDYWKQSLPHAPYLAMMIIGKFAIVKDSWKDKEVSYFVDPQYENDARKLFGNTPEMIDFFSNVLQVPYAWEKYAQVIGHDYVSGSMENTSATLHGDFLEKHQRELLDDNGEEFISHELFHQWFGDLVTCESWSNIPLNESFASYGEYLWNEHKYGREEADQAYQKDLVSYLRESKFKQVNMIRFNYEEREDMFDRHSYEKGEGILHMLRKYTGDNAFFASLKLYLERNKFKSVEIHNLRLAFEEITGEDMNWFFNQWFMSSGHPDLDISYQWEEPTKTETITIKQLQNLEKTPLFKLPLDVDIYKNGTTERHRIVLEKSTQSFAFYCATKPSFVNTDAEKMLVCTKKDHHTEEEWAYLYNNSKLYTDRKEALQFLVKDMKPGSLSASIFNTALSDHFWGLRQYAANSVQTPTATAEKDKLRLTLVSMIQNDPVATVRYASLKALIKNYVDDDNTTVFRNAIKDSSYDVSGLALEEFTRKNNVEGLQIAKSTEDYNVKTLRANLSSLYAEYGSDAQSDFMDQSMQRAMGFERYKAVDDYGKFLKRCKNIQTIKTGLTYINVQAVNEQIWFARLAAVQALKDLGSYFNDKSSTDTSYIQLKDTVDQYITSIKQNDKDERIRRVLSKN